jgi:hypothetical protein
MIEREFEEGWGLREEGVEEAAPGADAAASGPPSANAATAASGASAAANSSPRKASLPPSSSTAHSGIGSGSRTRRAAAAPDDDEATRLWGAPLLAASDFPLRTRSLLRFPLLDAATRIGSVEVHLAGLKVGFALSEAARTETGGRSAMHASPPLAAAAVIRIGSGGASHNTSGASSSDPPTLFVGIEMGVSPRAAANATDALVERGGAVLRRALLSALPRAFSAILGDEASYSSAADAFIDALDASLFRAPGATSGESSRGRSGEGVEGSEGASQSAPGTSSGAPGVSREPPFAAADGLFLLDFTLAPLASPNAM